MAATTSASKGRGAPGTRSSPNKKRFLGDKEVKPVLYAGKWEGYGSYIAGAIDGELVRDTKGKPLSFKKIGELRVI